MPLGENKRRKREEAYRRRMDRYLESQGLLNYQTKGLSAGEIAARYQQAGVKVKDNWFEQQYGKPATFQPPTQEAYLYPSAPSKPPTQFQYNTNDNGFVTKRKLPSTREGMDRYLESQGLLNYQTKGMSVGEIAARYQKAGVKVQDTWFQQNYGQSQYQPMNLTPTTSPVTETGGQAPMATVQDALNGTANWTDVSIEQRTKLLSDPNFYKGNQITQYPKWMQQQILADPKFDWKQLPENRQWMKGYYEIMSNPKIMAAPMALAGARAGGMFGLPGQAIGAILGYTAGLVGGQQYNPTGGFKDQPTPLAKSLFVLNALVDKLEMGIGQVGVYGRYKDDPEFQKFMENPQSREILREAARGTFESSMLLAGVSQNIPAALGAPVTSQMQRDIKDEYNRGKITYLEYLKLTLDAEKQKWEEQFANPMSQRFVVGAANPIDIFEGVTSPDQYLQSEDLVYDKAKKINSLMERGLSLKEASSAVWQEGQYDVGGQMGDLAGQMLADPLNIMPEMTTKALGKIANVTGHTVAAEAFKRSTAPFEAARKYKTLVQTGEAAKIKPEFKVSEMGNISRWVAGLNEKGEIRAGPFSKNGLLDKIPPRYGMEKGKGFVKNVTGFISDLARMDPQSRARLSLNMFSDNMGALLSRFDTIEEAGKYIKALANNDMETWSQLGSKFAESPEMYTVLPALKDYAGGKVDAITESYHLADANRDAALRMSNLLGENPNKWLDDIAERGTFDQDFRRVVERAKTMDTPEAKALLTDVEGGRITANTLKDIVDVFRGEGHLPFDPREAKALLYASLADHFDTWVAEKLLLNETPEAKRAFFQFAKTLKTSQSILLLGASPGYAIQNALSGVVHLAATGIYGMMTPKAMDNFMSRLELNPARLEEGVGIGGDLTPGPSPKGEGSRGGAITKAVAMLSKVSRGMPMSKLSSWTEKLLGKQGYVQGMKQFWNQSWRRGKGFKTMSPELTAAIREMGRDPNQIYAAIEAGMNQTEIENALYGRVRGVQARSLIDATAQKLGMDAGRAAEILDEVGVLDTLDMYLKGQTTKDGKGAAFRRAEQVAQDHMDMQAAEDVKARVEHIKQKAAIEQPAAMFEAIHQVNSEFADVWMEHYFDFGELMSDLDLLPDDAMKAKAIDQAYELSGQRFRRTNANKAATYKGLFEAWGQSDNPTAMEALSAFGEMDRIMGDAYTEMRQIRRGVTEKHKGNYGSPEFWDDVETSRKGIDRVFKKAFADQKTAEVKAGKALGGIFESLYGKAAGEAARQWWEDITRFNDENVKREQEFRRSLEGLTRDERTAKKNAYYQNEKIIRIDETLKINEAGLARLERIIRKGGDGSLVDSGPAPTQPPPSSANLGEGQTPTPPSSDLTPSPSPKGEGRQRVSVTEDINALVAQAEVREGAEAAERVVKVNALWDVAEEYARVGLPYDRTILQDRFALLGALRKPEYGGMADLTGLNDPRLTPELARSVMEASKIAKETEATQAMGNAMVNAVEAGSTVRIPKINENTTILRAIKEHGGLQLDQALTLTGKKRPKTAPGVFTRKGVNIDEMARMLADDGYPINLNDPDDMGGIQQTTALIEAARRGDKVYPMGHDHEAMIARAQDEAAAKAFAESFDFEGAPVDMGLWQGDFESAVRAGDLTRMYELIGELDEAVSDQPSVVEGETWAQYVSRVADETAARVEEEARDISIAESMVRADEAVREQKVRAEYAMTRQLLKEKFVEAFGDETQAAAWMEISDGLARWYESVTGESGEAMYARYYEDIVKAGDEPIADSLEQGYINDASLQMAREYYKNIQRHPEWLADAESYFGITDNPREAGYLLSDGRFLDLSGKNKGGRPNSRGLDHRDIYKGMSPEAKQMARDAGFTEMRMFALSTESLRFSIDPSEIFIESFSSIPTSEQIQTILKVSKGKNILFDITDANGGNLVSERIRKVTPEKLLDFVERTRRIFDGKESAKKVNALFQLQPVNRRMTQSEVEGYARALVRAGADELRRAVQGEASKADRIALLNEAHKLNPQLAESVARRMRDVLFQDGEFVDLTPSPSPKGEGIRAKGAVTFDTEGIKATIHAFEAADVSTLVHENAHVFRRMLSDVAEKTGNAKVLHDLKTMEEWAGAKDGVWTRAAEEKFARGFERYLADGKAPTPALKRAFESFKIWMLQVYRTITGSAIDVEFTPAVREVFDNMIDPLPENAVDGYAYRRDRARRVEISARLEEMRAEKTASTELYAQIASQGNMPDYVERVAQKVYQLQPVNRRMTQSEVAAYARALVRAGADELRRAVQGEASKADRIALLNEAHKLNPQLAESVARRMRDVLFQDANLPVGALDEASELMPRAQAMDEGWQKYVKPLLEGMEESAVSDQRVISGEGATKDMSPEGQKMLRQYMAGVKNDMATTKLAAMRWGESQRDFAMLNYSKRYGADRWLDFGIPYQFFYTRSLLTWAVRAIDRPAWYANYARLRMQQNRYERDIPERLRNKIKISAPWMPDWMGDNLYIDPLSNLFTPANFLKPFERMEQDRNYQTVEAERVLQEWSADGRYSEAEIMQAAQTRSGTVWERAFAEAQNRRESEIANPADFFTTMFGPAWYLSTPLNMMGIKVPGLSKGDPNKITNLPLTNTARGLEAVTRDTWAEPFGKLIGLLGKPEEWARKKAGLPTMGEYGEYYTKRQVANMVIEGKITSEQAQLAMIEKQGEIWDEAAKRVELELAMRVPTLGAIYAGLHDGAKGFTQAMLPTLFGSGLLPEGELEYRGLKQEWNEAWKQYNAGNKKAVTEFFDEHPEYEAYLAKGKKDEDLMQSFLIGQVWDGYMALGPTNQKQARAEMGELFQQAFLNKETRSYESIPTEQLLEWARMLKKLTPTVVSGQPLAGAAKNQNLSLYDPAVTNITDQFFEQRTKYFQNYYEEQQGYYALPKNQRAGYLLKHPSLKAYWDWKDKWYSRYPEFQPIFKGEVFKRVDTSTWAPGLEQYVMMYAYTGERLSNGAWKALEQQWIMEGRPYGDVKTWLNSQIVPAMLYGQ